MTLLLNHGSNKYSKMLYSHCSFTAYFQDQLHEHSKNCLHRQITCARLDCDVMLKYSKINEHFSFHEDHVVNKASKKSIKDVLKITNNYHDWNTWKMPPVELAYDNHKVLFLVHHSECCWQFYTILMGSKRDASNFQSTICITSQDGVSVKFGFLISTRRLVDINFNNLF